MEEYEGIWVLEKELAAARQQLSRMEDGARHDGVSAAQLEVGRRVRRALIGADVKLLG